MSATPDESGDRLSPKSLVRNAGALSVAGLVSSSVALPTSFLVARWLGLSDFGRVQWVVLVYGYATLARIGTFEAGVRAFIHYRARGDEAKAINAQNVGLSMDILFSVVVGIGVALWGVTNDDPLKRLGLLVAPFAVVCGGMAAWLGGLYLARESFMVVARASLFRGMVLPVLVLGGVALGGPAAVFIAPVLADAAVVVVYLLASRNGYLSLRFNCNWDVARRLLRVGVPLGLAVVVYWAYRLVGVTAISVALPPATLGVYAFAAGPVSVLARVVASVQAVLTPALWGRIASDDGGRAWVEEAARVTTFVAIVAAAVTNLGQALFGPLVHMVAPQFIDSIPIFEILCGNILLLSLVTVPSLVLDAESVNRQSRQLLIWLVALAVNAIVNFLSLSVGWGIDVIAWNDIWVQCVVVVVIFEAAARSQGSRWRRGQTYLRLGTVVVSAAAIGAVLSILEVRDLDAVGSLRQAAIRVCIAAVPWISALACIRRRSMQGRVGPEDG